MLHSNTLQDCRVRNRKNLPLGDWINRDGLAVHSADSSARCSSRGCAEIPLRIAVALRRLWNVAACHTPHPLLGVDLADLSPVDVLAMPNLQQTEALNVLGCQIQSAISWLLQMRRMWCSFFLFQRSMG